MDRVDWEIAATVFLSMWASLFAIALVQVGVPVVSARAIFVLLHVGVLMAFMLAVSVPQIRRIAEIVRARGDA